MSIRSKVLERVAAVAGAAAATATGAAAIAQAAAPPAPGPAAVPTPVRHVAARLAPASFVPLHGRAVHGGFTATMARLPQGAVLVWKLSVTGAEGRISAQIRLGGRGRLGPTLLLLCSPCGKTLRRSSFVPPPLVQPLLRGGAYISIATLQQPLGVARGQIEVLR